MNARRILVIDDNRAIHADFEKVLCKKHTTSGELDDAEAALFGKQESETNGRECFQIESAYQGQEGLTLIREALASRNPFAMAFVDVRMPPGWDGIETTSRIWEVDPDLQIVICTAYSDYSWDQILGKLGHSDRMVILKKPFDQIEVLQLATSLTRKWQLLQESKNRMADLEKMVAARAAQVVQEQDRFRAIFENSPEGIFQISPQGRLLSANPALATICGYDSSAEMMRASADTAAGLNMDSTRRHQLLMGLVRDKMVRDFEVEIKCKDGSPKWVNLTACKVSAADGTVIYHQGFVVDITAQKAAQQERTVMEAHLRNAQKLESVGQLAAGIAHEINTPIQYIGDNVRFVEESFADLSVLVAEYQNLAAAAQRNAVTPVILAAVEAACKQADFDNLSREIPGAIRESLEGVSHVRNIVRAMREFSHPGKAEKVPVDVNHAIGNALTVSRNEWKRVATVETSLAASLPRVSCQPGDFNQVILNLLVNAAHAIGDVVKDQPGVKGAITITTQERGRWVEIRVSDTGTGIAGENRHKIFEPFFTTKEIGKGTGQGLAIAHATIVKKHGGELTFESEVGKGSTFIIRLLKSDD